MSKGLKTVIWIVVIALIIWGIYAISNQKNKSQFGEEPVKIGLIMPLTGNGADIGISNEKAFNAAISEINDNGGINGKPIEVITEDNKGCDSATGVTEIQKLINIDKVNAVYSICSNVTLAIQPVAEEAGVVHLTCSSNPAIAEAGDYIFQIAPSDTFAGKVAAQYVADKFNAENVAILNCDKDWCVGLKDAFKEAFEKQGGKIVAEEQIASGTSDVRTELAKIKDSDPDLVYFTGYPEETITVFKRAKEIGLNVPFFGGDAWADASIPEQTKDFSDDKYYTVPSRNYSEEFAAKVDNDIAICAPEAYDTANILSDTIKKVGPNPEDIKNELYNLKNYKGEAGTIGFDENGNLIGASFDILTFENGEVITYDKGVKLK